MIHYTKNISLESDVPNNLKEIVLGAGCFWGVEKKFWDLDGVYLTSVGYSGGDTENPTYEDCLLYTSPSPRDMRRSRMPSSA